MRLLIKIFQGHICLGPQIFLDHGIIFIRKPFSYNHFVPLGYVLCTTVSLVVGSSVLSTQVRYEGRTCRPYRV